MPGKMIFATHEQIRQRVVEMDLDFLPFRVQLLFGPKSKLLQVNDSNPKKTIELFSSQQTDVSRPVPIRKRISELNLVFDDSNSTKSIEFRQCKITFNNFIHLYVLDAITVTTFLSIA